MRNAYALAAAMLLTTGLWAQSNRPPALLMPAGETIYGTTVTGLDEEGSRAGGDIIFQEDFANGLAGNNGFGPWTVGGPDGGIWRRKTTGPVGAYTNATAERIQSTTASNGFMVFGSDSANCTWSGSTPTALPPDQFTDWEGSLESPALNLSATPNVILQWQQRFRYCCGDPPQSVEISTDGGSTWPVTIYTNPFHPINSVSPTQSMAINLGPHIAANPANVKFRFRHSGEAGTSHYHWQIDDVKLMEAYDYDARLNYGLISHTNDGHEYARVPPNQFGPTFLLGGEVENMGAVNWTSASIDVSATLGSNPVLNATVPVGPVAAGDSAFAEFGAPPPPNGPAVGNYTFSFSAAPPQAEQNPTNNQTQRWMQVSNSLYSLDGIGVVPTNQLSSTTIASNSFTGVTSGLTVMTFYRVTQPILTTGIELVLSNTNPGGTEAGGYVVGQLLDSAGVLNASALLPAPLLASDPVDITSAVVSAGIVNIPLNDGNPYLLTPGDYYLAVTLVGVDGNGTVRRIVVRDDLTVPQPGWASAIHFSTPPSGGQARTYSNGNAFAIRMKVVGNVGVDELQAGASMLYPNPTNGLLTYADGQPGKREVAVFDALGHRVATAIGQGPLTLDLSAFADGMYSVRIASEAGVRTERVILAR